MKAVNYLKALGGVACVVLACSAYAQASDTSAAATAPATASAPAAKAVKKANRQLGYTVRKALAKAQGLDVSNISVRARGGAVTLTGTVPDQGQIDTAGDTAKGVKGVTSVTNKLSVMQQ
ncbi:BON domain-containing protein [Trinickia violacea]|uniref:BON domain-containing protein n=1 Tax=Trinickia violacea TaxID=2571746 RepID=A0A4P8IS61_9BURK|nr:BON domain-containing protein [Trinickia violacea]QCP50887.1 BON domain-containing protein [Trinickia violacea]